jgi:hypothetical protein
MIKYIMNWKLRGRKWSLPNLWCDPGICLDGQLKTTKIPTMISALGVSTRTRDLSNREHEH